MTQTNKIISIFAVLAVLPRIAFADIVMSPYPNIILKVGIGLIAILIIVAIIIIALTIKEKVNKKQND